MSSFHLYVIKRSSDTPRDPKRLREWGLNQIESTPAEDRDDRCILGAPLKKFYEAMLKEFPALNGRDETNDDSMIDKALDYYLSKNVIMLDCAYSQYSLAIQYANYLARKYGLCVYHYHTQSIDIFEEIDAPKGYLIRHYTDDFPSLWKAITLSLKTPAILSAIIFADYYLLKWLCELFPPPYYYPSIHIPLAAVAVFTAIVDVLIFVLDVRNERRGIRTTYDEVIINSAIIPPDCQYQG